MRQHALALILLATLPGVVPAAHADARPVSAQSACGFAIHASAIGLPEVRATARHGQAWALFFFSPPAQAGEQLKIAWHVTGRGRLRLHAVGPDGETVKPAWGPEAHGGSNWNRPGAEWGTGFILPTPGCWTIRVRRGRLRAALGLQVVPHAENPATG